MQWTYGFSTDVVGRLVEVLSGQSLDRFFYERIFQPLDMKGTTTGYYYSALHQRGIVHQIANAVIGLGW